MDYALILYILTCQKENYMTLMKFYSWIGYNYLLAETYCASALLFSCNSHPPPSSSTLPLNISPPPSPLLLPRPSRPLLFSVFPFSVFPPYSLSSTSLSLPSPLLPRLPLFLPHSPLLLPHFRLLIPQLPLLLTHLPSTFLILLPPSQRPLSHPAIFFPPPPPPSLTSPPLFPRFYSLERRK